MISGTLTLGKSTNPDKDMLLTADSNGVVDYLGKINLPMGKAHSLIVVIRNRKIENDIRVFLKRDPENQINFRGQRSDHQKISFHGKGELEVVVQAENLKPGEVIQVQDLVVKPSYPILLMWEGMQQYTDGVKRISDFMVDLILATLPHSLSPQT